MAKGFTLMEMVVTMSILAVLSGIAVASLDGFSSSQQEVAVTRVRSAVVHAQLWAISTGASTWVAFDPAAELVTVYREDPDSPGKANRLPMMDPLTHGDMRVQLGSDNSGITAAAFGATTEIHFDGEGRPHDANGTLLANDGTVTFNGGITLRVVRNTGLIKVD